MANFYYGGQAVVEGVMMRGQGHATVAMRRPDGEIEVYSETLPNSLYRGRVARLPLIRGLVALWEMLILGTRMMLYSAAVQARVSVTKEIPKRMIALMLAFSLAFAVSVFFILPLLITHSATGQHSGFFGNVIEGLVRLALFLAYLGLIGRMERMRRVFQYHGAEHKTINAFEAGADLDPASVQRFSTIHIRCGTAFLLWVVVLSIFVFALIGHPPILIGIAARVVLVPVVAALGYEILRLAARFYSFAPVRIAVQPGLWLQRLTTREPDDDQVAVAIAALIPVLQADHARNAPSVSRESAALSEASGASV